MPECVSHHVCECGAEARERLEAYVERLSSSFLVRNHDPAALRGIKQMVAIGREWVYESRLDGAIIDHNWVAHAVAKIRALAVELDGLLAVVELKGAKDD